MANTCTTLKNRVKSLLVTGCAESTPPNRRFKVLNFKVIRERNGVLLSAHYILDGLEFHELYVRSGGRLVYKRIYWRGIEKAFEIYDRGDLKCYRDLRRVPDVVPRDICKSELIRKLCVLDNHEFCAIGPLLYSKKKWATIYARAYYNILNGKPATYRMKESLQYRSLGPNFCYH